MWALHPGLSDVLSTPNLGSWCVIEAVGREMWGEVVGSARILEIFVKHLTFTRMVVFTYIAFFSNNSRWN